MYIGLRDFFILYIMYKFSKRSLRKLDTVWEPLQALAHRVIDKTDIDFGITCGIRTAEEQHDLYEIGRTKNKNRKPVTYCDGYKKKVIIRLEWL